MQSAYEWTQSTAAQNEGFRDRAIVPYMFGMADSRIDVSSEELATALAVWIKTAPKRIWWDYWKHSETVAKWSAGSDPFDRFDPRDAMAAYLAGKFRQANWAISYPKPLPIGDAAMRPKKASDA